MDAAITPTDLAAFVAAPSTDPYLQACCDEASELVSTYAGPSAASVPIAVYRRATLEVAADLYHRRSARNGVAGFDDNDLTPAPVRINRDPLVPARPILRPWLGVGIA